MLAIVGIGDDMVLCENTCDIIKVCSNAQSRTIFFSKGNHIFNVLSEDKIATKNGYKRDDRMEQKGFIGYYSNTMFFEYISATFKGTFLFSCITYVRKTETFQTLPQTFVK